MFRQFFIFLLFALYLTSFTACKSDYEKMVTRELATGQRHDSLFLGMYLGMSRDSFYKHCLHLNHQGIITNGPRNLTAQYTLPGSEPRVDFNFYPKFKQNEAVLMDAYFNYADWAPWNVKMHAEALLPVALDTLEKWYGPGFIEMKNGDKRVFVKVNGNRRIRVYLTDNQYVTVEMRDLTAPEPDM